jgi:formylglycine-generating enzyme required for sulfatase activity
MPRVQALLECLGLALCEKARKAFYNEARIGDVLPDVAKAMLDYAHKELPTGDLRHALGELAALSPEQYAPRLDKLIEGLARVHAIPSKEGLIEYLKVWPATVRQVLRRPSDPTGRSAPDGLQFYKPDDILMFLPPRVARFQPGAEPAGLDDWRLTELRGMGECCEVWVAADENRPDRVAALKFATDPSAAEQVAAGAALFQKVFELNDLAGVVPLRTVYLETDPPALEYKYVSGYELTGLMYEWKWRFDAAKPEAALKLIKRLAEIVGLAHAKGLVHRDLKPSNVLLHPTEGGRFTIWVTDMGWGQIAAARSIELGRGGTPRGERHRLELRGAHTPLYACPQMTKKEAPDPRDDVHALGVIWYQLLKRDPHAPPPVGTEWAEEFFKHGFTDSQARLLSACIATRPDKRPADANALAEMLRNVAVAVSSPQDGSKIIQLKPPSGEFPPVGGPKSGKLPKPAEPPVPTGYGGLPRLVTNSVGMTFVLIPPGMFKMGSPDTEPGRREHEGPQHEVMITRPYYLSVYPVTQGQYERVVGKNPSHFNRAHGGGPDHPVETVGWQDAEQFCARLGLLPEEEIHGRVYRLPTEAEWERACRAGTHTPFWCGEKLTPKEAHFAAAGAFAKTGGSGRTAPVGTVAPNPWGLYDMHGNVQEWVQDWYDEYYYFDSPKEDPEGPDHGHLKVTRGGCWVTFGADCRSAARRPHAPDSPSNAIGFRVVMVASGGSE